MTFYQIMNMLKARYRFLIFSTFIVLSFSLMMFFLLPQQYKSSSTIIFNYKYSDPITGVSLPAQLIPGYMATEVDIIKSKNIAKDVIDQLNLMNITEYQEEFESDVESKGDFKEWLSEYILKNLAVTPSRTSNFINISFKHKDPQFASDVANAFTEAYIKKSIVLKVSPSQHAAEFYTEQLNTLKNNVNEINERYISYQQTHNIQSSDGNLDIETAKLNNLSTLLLTVESQALSSKLKDSFSLKNYKSSPDIIADKAVQSYESQLNIAETEFNDVASRFAEKHPDYVAAKLKLNKARSALSDRIKIVSSSLSSTSSIDGLSSSQIKKELDKQREKVIQLNKDRSQLKLLEQELKNAQEDYNEAHKRFIKNNFEGESNQSNITILNKATPSIKAYFPNFWVFSLIGIVLGPLLGFVILLIEELSNKRVRSLKDIEVYVNSPIYAVLPKSDFKQIQ